MSDVLQKYCDLKKFKDDIVIDTDHCLRYVNTQCVNSDEIVFTVHITNNVLKQWQDLKDTQQSKDISFSFVEILNLFLAQNHAIVIKKDCSRIEERLRRLASVAKRNSSGKRGRTSLEFCKRSKSIAIRSCEILKAADLVKEVCDLKAAKSVLEQENVELQRRCNDLYESLVQEEALRNAAVEELKEAQTDQDKVKKENTRLWQYIDIISEQEGFQNCGKPISEVEGRQQRRKIRELKTYVEKALWFAESFGLKLRFVQFADDDEKLHTIDYKPRVAGKKCYKDLCDEEKIKV